MSAQKKEPVRLSDHILNALKIALDQQDVQIAEILVQALELSMTRNTGGSSFMERREYPTELEQAMDKLGSIKGKKKSGR